MKCLFKDLHQLWRCYKRKHHQTSSPLLLRAPAIALGLQSSAAYSLAVHRRRKGTPCKVFSLEMINETNVSWEVRAGVFFSSIFPSRSSVRTHLRFLTSGFKPAHLCESDTLLRPLNSCFQAIGGFITSFYNRCVISALWLLMIKTAVFAAS